MVAELQPSSEEPVSGEPDGAEKGLGLSRWRARLDAHPETESA